MSDGRLLIKTNSQQAFQCTTRLLYQRNPPLRKIIYFSSPGLLIAKQRCILNDILWTVGKLVDFHSECVLDETRIRLRWDGRVNQEQRETVEKSA